MNVCCIIVSRGDHDLMPCFETMPEHWQKLVWINGAYLESWGPEGFMHDAGVLNLQPVGGYVFPDLSVYGRYEAIKHTSADLIYVQDDDVIVSDPQAIVDEWLACEALPEGHPGHPHACHVVCNMPFEFRPHYGDSALVGFGACFARDLPERVFGRAVIPEQPGDSGGPTALRNLVSPSFNRTCDVVFTTLTPRVLVDVPKVNREFAEDASRMYRTPGHVEERARMLALAREVRDG